jgi:hypothetical protein
VFLEKSVPYIQNDWLNLSFPPPLYRKVLYTNLDAHFEELGIINKDDAEFVIIPSIIK